MQKIRNKFRAQAHLIDPMGQLEEEEFEKKKQRLIWDMVMHYRPMIARFGDLYRKYNMAKFYETKNPGDRKC